MQEISRLLTFAPLNTILVQGRSIDPDAAAAATAGVMAIGCVLWVILVIMFCIFPVFAFWKIFSKAGFSGALSFLTLIPGIGFLIAICILAFSDWPALKDRR